MANLRVQLRVSWRSLVTSLRDCGDVDLATWLAMTGTDLEDLYQRAHGGWTALRREAGYAVLPSGPDEVPLARAIGRMLHLDDPERSAVYGEWLSGSTPPRVSTLNERDRRLLHMLDFDLWGPGVAGGATGLVERLALLWAHQATRTELFEVLAVVSDRAAHLPVPLGLPLPGPPPAPTTG